MRLLLVLILVAVYLLGTYAAPGNYHPEQIRLVLTGDSKNTHLVSYVTGSSVNSDYVNIYTQVPKSYAFYGTDPQSLTFKSIGTSRHFTFEKYHSDVHEVLFTNLIPNTRYYYRVGDSTKPNGLSDLFSFSTHPIHQYAVFGDYGYVGNERSIRPLLQHLHDNAFQGIFHVGDIAYNLEDEDGAIGDHFLNTVQSLSAYVPYHTMPGNHERTGNFTHYHGRFSSLEHLGRTSGSNTKLWYSFNAPYTHFVTFDTEIFKYFPDDDQQERQYEWLEADLKLYNKKENRKQYPWIITLSHKCDWQSKTKFKKFRKLFHKYGVDLHLCGHQHNYQRLYPGFKEDIELHHDRNLYINPKEWTQIVIGSPGCYSELGSSVCPYEGGLAQMYFTYGFGLLDVRNSTHLYWNFVETHRAHPSDGEDLFASALISMQPNTGSEILDSLLIIQDHHGKREKRQKDDDNDADNHDQDSDG